MESLTEVRRMSKLPQENISYSIYYAKSWKKAPHMKKTNQPPQLYFYWILGSDPSSRIQGSLCRDSKTPL